MSVSNLHAPARRVELRFPFSLTPSDLQQPLAVADQLSGFAAGLTAAEDLATECRCAEQLAYERQTRAAEADLDISPMERLPISAACRLGVGRDVIPSAPGSVRALAFA